MLGEAERRRVEAAIREAERNTAGEIVVVVTRQAGRYRAAPLVYALATVLLVPWVLIGLTSLGPVRIALIQLAAGLAAFVATVPRRWRARLVPRPLLRARAREVAEGEFRSRGMAETRGRTGILLFVAEAERHAEVIGDVTIADKVPESAWRGVIEALTDAFGRRAYADGLVAAIAEIGDILQAHAPPGSGDTDELPNRVVVL